MVLAIVIAFVSLGMWQLGRLGERQEENAVASRRLSLQPQPWEFSDGTVAEFTRLVVRGDFADDEEVLLRSQTYLGQPGFHVLTPLYLDAGGALFVNRGWVPLAIDGAGAEQTSPRGASIVEGYVRRPLPEAGGSIPDSRIVASIDPVGFAELTTEPTADFYLVATSLEPAPGELPIILEAPELSEGPHLSYAVQWFAFALVSCGGYAALLRTTARKPR